MADVNRRHRPGGEAEWEEILHEENGIIAGDFNCHSKRWDSGVKAEGADFWTRWTEELIDTYDLQIINNGKATYHKDNSDCSSAIDLTLAGRKFQIEGWEVVTDDDAPTGSGHEVIRWRAKGIQELGNNQKEQVEDLPSSGIPYYDCASWSA